MKVHKFMSVGNILHNEPTGERNIFFLNTSDVSSGIDLLPRSACAIESAGEFLRFLRTELFGNSEMFLRFSNYESQSSDLSSHHSASEV